MDLVVKKRETFGKAVRHLRGKGIIPAELYGRGIANLHLEVSSKEFNKVFKTAGESSVISVMLDKEKHPALVYEVGRNPVSDEIVSVDFYQVRLDEKIKIKIPIRFIGEPPAVKEKNAILVRAMSEIEIEAFPNDIPPVIEVTLTVLKDIGDSVYVKDLKISDKVKLMVTPETVVATATAKMTEEEEKALEAEGSVESVKVETEEKKAERIAKETAEAAEAAKPGTPEPKKS